MVLWITGLSGAGKSTLGREVVRQLRESGQAAVLLDGDAVRAAIDDPHTGHDPASRLTNAMRICRLAKLLADQGISVVVATMSLRHEVFAWNRTNLPGYFEVYLRVSLEVLRNRDARGLYGRAARGDVQDVVGIHLGYDEPAEPDLVLMNDDHLTEFESLARHVVECCRRRETDTRLRPGGISSGDEISAGPG